MFLNYIVYDGARSNCVAHATYFVTHRKLVVAHLGDRQEGDETTVIDFPDRVDAGQVADCLKRKFETTYVVKYEVYSGESGEWV